MTQNNNDQSAGNINFNKSGGTDGGAPLNITSDNIPTVALPETGQVQTPESEAAAGAENIPGVTAPSAENSMPFWKRKWVLITAPIVAGVLLLGIGGSAGYAFGEVSERGGNWENNQRMDYPGGSGSDRDRDHRGECGGHRQFGGGNQGSGGQGERGSGPVSGFDGSHDENRDGLSTERENSNNPGTENSENSSESDPSRGSTPAVPSVPSTSENTENTPDA